VHIYCDRFHDTSDMDAAIQRPRRIPAFPTQRFSEYTSQININPVLRNIQAEWILPWQQILLTVKSFLSKQIVAMEA
jgi:hypothetical protein